MLFYANDKYEGFLQTTYNVGDSNFDVDNTPLKVPTIVVSAPGTEYEAIFSITGKTINALTGVARLRGYNGQLITGTVLICLNTEEFINQYSDYSGINPKGEYVEDTQYMFNDLVYFNGSGYIAIKNTLGHLPTDTDYWKLAVSKGDTGTEIELQTTETHIQWRYVGGEWVNLLALEDIKGAKGDTGSPGTDGTNGLGVPAGGATGKVLKKKSGTDNDTEWGDAGLDTLQVVLSSQVFS